MITPCDVARLALDLGKATFDNTFTTVTIVQEWVEDGVRRAVGAVPWVPGPVKGVVDESIGFLERTRGDLKQTVDRCYRLVADMVTADAEEAAATPPASPAGSPRGIAKRRGCRALAVVARIALNGLAAATGREHRIGRAS